MSPKPIDAEDYDRLFLKMTALTDANMQLANAVLAQSQAQNRIVPLLTRVQNDVHSLLNSDELVKANLEQRLRTIDINVALILNEVSDVKEDVDDVQKDITNTRLKLESRAKGDDDKKGQIIEFLQTFERMSVKSKLFIIVLIIAIGSCGWVYHLLAP